jgi:16S rRNA (uracil1498-N3)-methyltransferase
MIGFAIIIKFAKPFTLLTMHVFYYPDLVDGPSVLPEPEARHGIRVLRLRRGDVIGITDGRGTFAKAEIVENDVQNCVFRVIEQLTDVNQSRPKLHIAISPLQQLERFEWFLEKATEIGIHSITPLICERTIRPSIRAERMQKIIVSAMKQSAGVWLPKFNEPVPFREFILQPMPLQRFIPHCLNQVRQDLTALLVPHTDTVVLIGPEGDFTSSEIEMAVQNHFLPVSLGPSRLRTETAGLVVCCAFLMAQLPARKSAI